MEVKKEAVNELENPKFDIAQVEEIVPNEDLKAYAPHVEFTKPIFDEQIINSDNQLNFNVLRTVNSDNGSSQGKKGRIQDLKEPNINLR